MCTSSRVEFIGISRYINRMFAFFSYVVKIFMGKCAIGFILLRILQEKHPYLLTRAVGREPWLSGTLGASQSVAQLYESLLGYKTIAWTPLWTF